MKEVRKVLGALIATTVLSTSVLAADKEFKVLPVFTDGNWCGQTEVAVVVGSSNFDKNELSTGVNYGVEVSFDCPIFTLPGDHLLRQQVSLSRYDKNNFTVTVIEMNPYYFFDITKDLVLGVGPGIAAVHGDADNAESKWAFAYQAGAGLKYYMDDFLVGLDVRWQWTDEKDFGAGKEDLDNMRVLLKAGYRF
ncbi:MAG: porin family protein [Sulfurimonas sp.]|uniref:outer membrane protein n=1 Tax=Sulfurimonas sp. TaxID=2022749 RepID=UPI0026191C63|nr:outer membrane beta-barrel protein [Sulfurimonas sp.]MCW8894688.1 porin family protein [Sulfurimonas sp.]MCW8955095.1 porin family protein [Sulfurimonas sp.]MCW9068143.1 porin family protein [Sulfurimonas sp.]